MDHTDVLRRLAINDSSAADADGRESPFEPEHLDARTVALVRLAALVSVNGPAASYGAEVEAAITNGASSAEIVDVLVGVIPIVGLPRVVAAAPRLATALGYDDALERHSDD